jgi:hypothetical protein
MFVTILDHSLFNVCKSLELFKLFYKFYLIFDKNIVVKPSIRPDIRYPALTGYPVSGKNSIRCIPSY